jgi:hypothetical protein
MIVIMSATLLGDLTRAGSNNIECQSPALWVFRFNRRTKRGCVLRWVHLPLVIGSVSASRCLQSTGHQQCVARLADSWGLDD